MFKDRLRVLWPPLMLGALALPATYELSRYGMVLVSIVVIAILGITAGAMSTWRQASRWEAVAAFVAAALLMELTVFGHYYIDYGHRDPELGVGAALSLIEFTAIALLGSLGISVSHWVVRERGKAAQ